MVKGKVLFITGAAQGIGFEIAKEFLMPVQKLF